MIYTQLFQIHFVTGNSTELNSTRVKLLDFEKQKDAILIIEHAELSDRNYYNCTAKNQASDLAQFEAVPQQTYVRVKGRIIIMNE